MPSRHEVIIDQLDPQSSDRIVEIGCGHGVAASLVLERLTSGTYTGVDQSAAMIAAATSRNAGAITDGRARFVVARAEEFAGGPFDRLFAARVRELETPEGFGVARRLLAPRGLLLLAIDGPSAVRARSTADAALVAAQAAGFQDVRRHDGTFDGGAVVCVAAVRS